MSDQLWATVLKSRQSGREVKNGEHLTVTNTPGSSASAFQLQMGREKKMILALTSLQQQQIWVLVLEDRMLDRAPQRPLPVRTVEPGGAGYKAQDTSEMPRCVGVERGRETEIFKTLMVPRWKEIRHGLGRADIDKRSWRSNLKKKKKKKGVTSGVAQWKSTCLACTRPWVWCPALQNK